MIEIFEFVKSFISACGGAVGICSAEKLNGEYYRGFTPFVKEDISLRIDPSSVLPEVKSVIAVCLPHPVPARREEGPELSSLGSFEDYHISFKAVLHQLVSELKLKYSFLYKILVDSATLDERAFAVRAGLGFLGRNGMFIARGMGSFINLGLILTDMPIKSICEDNPGVTAETRCPPSCRLCINACPGGALCDGKPLNAARCASYITQKKGELSGDEMKIMGRNLYGCDICRDVCPFNKKTPRIETRKIEPNDLLALSDKELAGKIKNTAMAWKGAELLKRNAAVVLNNLTVINGSNRNYQPPGVCVSCNQPSRFNN